MEARRMNSNDSSSKPASSSSLSSEPLSKPLMLLGVVAFLAVITMELLERKWISAVFWLAMLSLQVLTPRKFHWEKPVKWILVTIICLLAIFQWWSYFSRGQR